MIQPTYPTGPCGAPTRKGTSCRCTEIFENGRCSQHGGRGLTVRDRRMIDRTHTRLTRILRRAAEQGVPRAAEHLARLLDRYRQHAEGGETPTDPAAEPPSRLWRLRGPKLEKTVRKEHSKNADVLRRALEICNVTARARIEHHLKGTECATDEKSSG